jgi:putative membrane protein
MTKTFCLTLLAFTAIAGITACAPAGNTNVNGNANRAVVNSANTNSNTGSAANSVANTISNTAAALTTDSPDDFMKSAAEGGMAEVELGKLAATKAQNPEVKKFAQMMVTDHTKANAELKALAAKKNVALPADMGSHKSAMDDLNGLSGAEFDKEYVDSMVDDHEDTVAAFQKQADNSADADVKAFAAKTLPTLKRHLEAIKEIHSKMP